MMWRAATSALSLTDKTHYRYRFGIPESRTYYSKC
jgi:hypothetical protein